MQYDQYAGLHFCSTISFYGSLFMKYKESEVHDKHLREKILCANLHYFEEHPRKSQTYHRIDDKRKYCVNEELYSFD